MIDKERLEAHMNNGETEYVMCAAVHVSDLISHPHQPFNIDDGLVYCGWRHPSVLAQIPRSKDEQLQTQGFLTTKNRFLNREEALELVKQNGQLKKELIGGMLTSEDLW